MINNQLCQKIKLPEKGDINPLTIILTLPLTCGLKLPINKGGGGRTREIFNFEMGGRVETRFELGTPTLIQ